MFPLILILFFSIQKGYKTTRVTDVSERSERWASFSPFNDWCRISTGTADEVDKFINGMLEVYKG